jgi:hypothetical protein
LRQIGAKKMREPGGNFRSVIIDYGHQRRFGGRGLVIRPTFKESSGNESIEMTTRHRANPRVISGAAE